MRAFLEHSLICSAIALVCCIAWACTSPGEDPLDDSPDAASAVTNAAESQSHPTEFRFALESSDFWDLPLPSDLRATADWERWPATEDNAWIGMWLRAAARRKLRWGVNAGAFLPFTGALDPSTLPQSPEASLDPDAAAFWIDVDPRSPHRGQRIPVRFHFNAAARAYAPANLLSVLPEYGFVRRDGTRYAVVITSAVRDAGGSALRSNAAFSRALMGAADANEAWAEHLAPLRQTLELEGHDPASVVAATVFTTLDSRQSIEALANWAEALPAPAIRGWAVAREAPDYVAVEGSLELPVVQTGERPYRKVGEGLIDWNGDAPQVNSQQRVRLIVSVPRQRGGAPLPLVLYLHGSGGDAEQFLDRGAAPDGATSAAENQNDAGATTSDANAATLGEGPAAWLARAGLAAAGFDFPLHGLRHDPPDESGLMLYNLLGNIDATIDNFLVAQAELVLLSKVLLSLRIDPGAHSELAALGDGVFAVEPSALFTIGQSMGSTIGVGWASVDPRLRGAVWSGAGGMLTEIALTATAPLELEPVLAQLMQIDVSELDETHPLLHAFQSLWDLVEPVAMAPSIRAAAASRPRCNDQLVLAGYEDRYFSPRSQAALALALGAPLVGDAAEDELPHWLRLGRPAAEPPVARNVAERCTFGVIQYLAPGERGHDILFDNRDVQRRVSCFLRSAVSGSATIVAGDHGCD